MKKIILLILTLVFGSAAQAGFVCEQSCSGTTSKIIDAALPQYQKDSLAFQEACAKRGGTVQTGGGGDANKFDEMGCRVVDYRPYSYCVIEEKVTAAGFAITAISADGGGLFTATAGATDSCKKNLGRFSCGERTQLRVGDITYGEFNCREF